MIKDLKLWNIYNKTVYMYPSQKITFDGLKIRGSFNSASRCCGNGVYLRGLLVEGHHHPQLRHPGDGGGNHRARGRLRPRAEPHVENSFLRNYVNLDGADQRLGQRLLDEQQAGGREQHAVRSAAGASLNAIAMVRDVASAPECLSKLDEMRVYAYNGVASDNFQVYHPNTSVLPRPPAGCTPTTRAGINGLICPIAPLGSPVPRRRSPGRPTATLTAVADIDSGRAVRDVELEHDQRHDGVRSIRGSARSRRPARGACRRPRRRPTR